MKRAMEAVGLMMIESSAMLLDGKINEPQSFEMTNSFSKILI
ncbi:hypothetical protein [Bacillus sp. J14TS2]|nr:hypothetical protein [Bacillus sp. J14TS2]